MKTVLLLGDSIRQNYQCYVKEKLQGKADVRYPDDNGRFAAYTLRYIYEWISVLSRDGNVQFDIVHFNVGLWDVLRLSNEDDTFTHIDDYCNLLKRIISRIKFCLPGAEIVFALSTKVREPGFTPGRLVGYRSNDDIMRFNNAARLLMEKNGIEVNDLWSVSVSLPEDAHSDDVHYETTKGIEALGGAVVRTLEGKLIND